jgi:indolepyruvate decarboxylase
MPALAPFIIERLKNVGVKHVFGVPGDYILPTYKRLSESKDITLVNCTDEAHAGFAADGYARVNGVGCVCVTYNVGALKIMNSVACAYAERSPVIVLCGSPGMKERKQDVLLHHMVRSFECQEEIFRNITCATAVLKDPNTAPYELDRVLEAMAYHRQPIYIELPRDIAEKTVSYDVYQQGTPTAPTSDPENLKEALAEVREWIKGAKSPVIMAGVELARHGFGGDLVKFAERSGIPIVTELLSKSTIGEQHPLFRGVYGGETSRDEVKSLVENSDCLLLLGVLVTDMTLSFMPPKFKKRDTVHATVGGLKVRNHAYEKIVFPEFLKALFREDVGRRDVPAKVKVVQKKFEPSSADLPITTARFFDAIEGMLDKTHAIVSDVGESLFGAMDLPVHQSNHFLGDAYYTTMGFAIPAALGAQLANPAIRPLVLVGDGAFQMSLSEISTMIDRGLNPIIFVINNQGYATERLLLDGKFNNVRNWNYHKVSELFGGGVGIEAKTETELADAIHVALSNKTVTVINVVVDPKSQTPALQRMAAGLSKKVNDR